MAAQLVPSLLLGMHLEVFHGEPMRRLNLKCCAARLPAAWRAGPAATSHGLQRQTASCTHALARRLDSRCSPHVAAQSIRRTTRQLRSTWTLVTHHLTCCPRTRGLVRPSTHRLLARTLTGDALGDMYFDMRSVATPMECAHPDPESAHDCDNQEVTAPDLVITKLVLDVKGKGPVDGDYGRCNICVNGTDHHGNNSCIDGVYWCLCGDYHASKQCGPDVGLENITESMSRRKCYPGSEKWDCWKDNTAAKTGGAWYSTTSAGYCGDGTSPAPPGCTWSVKEVVKVVNKSCSDDSMCNPLPLAPPPLPSTATPPPLFPNTHPPLQRGSRLGWSRQTPRLGLPTSSLTRLLPLPTCSGAATRPSKPTPRRRPRRWRAGEASSRQRRVGMGSASPRRAASTRATTVASAPIATRPPFAGSRASRHFPRNATPTT